MENVSLETLQLAGTQTYNVTNIIQSKKFIKRWHKVLSCERRTLYLNRDSERCKTLMSHLPPVCSLLSSPQIIRVFLWTVSWSGSWRIPWMCWSMETGPLKADPGTPSPVHEKPKMNATVGTPSPPPHLNRTLKWPEIVMPTFVMNHSSNTCRHKHELFPQHEADRARASGRPLKHTQKQLYWSAGSHVSVVVLALVDTCL